MVGNFLGLYQAFVGMNAIWLAARCQHFDIIIYGFSSLNYKMTVKLLVKR